MKTPWKKFLAVAAVVGAGPVSAIPIVFDFTGTVHESWDVDYSSGLPNYVAGPAGAAFNAQLTVDSDLFGSAQAWQETFSDNLQFRSDPNLAVSGSLSIDGVAIDLRPYSESSGVVGFRDSLGYVSCGEGCGGFASDQWYISLASEENTPEARRMRTFGVNFLDDLDLANPAAGTDWFDFSQGVDVGSIATLPMLSSSPLYLTFTDYLWDCTDGCQETGLHTSTLSVSSVTRSVASVPEPGTLGLLAVGLAGVWFARRRQSQRI